MYTKLTLKMSLQTKLKKFYLLCIFLRDTTVSCLSEYEDVCNLKKRFIITCQVALKWWPSEHFNFILTAYFYFICDEVNSLCIFACQCVLCSLPYGWLIHCCVASMCLTLRVWKSALWWTLLLPPSSVWCTGTGKLLAFSNLFYMSAFL